MSAAGSDPAEARRLAELSIALILRYETQHQPTDLDRAVEAGTRALDLTASDHPSRVALLNNLTYALSRRVDLTADPQDVDQLVRLAEESLILAPLGHPDHTHRLSSLAYALSHRFDVSQDRADLDRTISCYETVVDFTPADHPDRAVRLTSLGNELRRRFDLTGSMPDLNRAIDVCQESVDIVAFAAGERAGILSNLGIALQRRFRATESPIDLERAIDLKERALVATAATSPDRPRFLVSLAIDLQERWERSGRLSDVDAAISLSAEAATLANPGGAVHLHAVDSHASALSSRFRVMGRPEDLDEAIGMREQALAVTPRSQPGRAKMLCDLSGDLCRSFDQTSVPEELDRAVEASEEAVTIASADRHDRALAALSLGLTLASRYRFAGREVDLDRALTLLDGVVETPTVRLPDRMRAAWAAGSLAAKAHRWERATASFATAVESAQEMVPRALRRTTQEFRLRSISGLAAAAAAACLDGDDADRAVEMIEQGRSPLFAQMLDSHPDLADLTEAHPLLAAQLARVLDEINRPIDSDLGDTSSGGSAAQAASLRAQEERRGSAAVKFEQLRAEVRGLPGFARFMGPTGSNELRSAANDGAVVVINVHHSRCDALVVRCDGVDTVPLPRLTFDDAVANAERFTSAVRQAQASTSEADQRDRAEGELVDVLGWLWDSVTGPVLDHLGHAAVPATVRRVWWCPSGPLGHLPFHAAGHHDTRFEAEPLTVLDRVISSTTPTIRALLHCRRPGKKPPAAGQAPGPVRLLVVAMPETPDHADLPAAAIDVAIVTSLFPSGTDVLGPASASPATRDTVLAALPTHPWIHVSCHGISDPIEPSASRLLLSDHRLHPLTVLDITRVRLDDGQLAFLSACSTAQAGHLIPDEPIHLSAAFLATGYRQVIATLWPIAANDAVAVTRIVYRELAGAEADASTTAAPALHSAVLGLRALYPSRPSRWAAYTHSGI